MKKYVRSDGAVSAVSAIKVRSAIRQAAYCAGVPVEDFDLDVLWQEIEEETEALEGDPLPLEQVQDVVEKQLRAFNVIIAESYHARRNGLSI